MPFRSSRGARTVWSPPRSSCSRLLSSSACGRARFAAPALFDGESYHLQVPTPNDVLVAQAVLRLQTRSADCPEGKPFDERPLMVERRVERCSLYARAPSPSHRDALSEAGKLEKA